MRTRRYSGLIVVLVAAFNLLLAACSREQVATVNGEAILRTTLSDQLTKRHGKEVLDDLIIEHLVEQAARKKRIVPTEAEIKRRFSYLVQPYSSERRLLAELKKRGLSKQDALRQLRFQVLTERLVGSPRGPAESTLRKEYDRLRHNEFGGKSFDQVRDQIRQSYISFETAQKLPKLIDDLRQRAKIVNYLVP